jgi:hypothetical protein
MCTTSQRRDDQQNARGLHPSSAVPISLLFDLQLNIERLEQQVEHAAAAGVPAPWAQCEAECSLDLIEAELAALRKVEARQSAPATTYLSAGAAATPEGNADA